MHYDLKLSKPDNILKLYTPTGQPILIPTRSGRKHLLMVDQFTYSQINYSPRWVCSSKAQGCPAKLRYEDGQVHRILTEHNHPPPRYIFKNGMYIKL